MPLQDDTAADRPAIVHLLGYPGVGKYTVARELVRLASSDDRRFVLVDNHLTSNVIFSVLPVDGADPEPLDRAVWDRVDEVRAALHGTIRDLSPRGWSFVFTNVALEGDAVDRRSVARVRELADARRSHYVPVRLHCDTDEHLRRVVRPDRIERMKWIDSDAVRDYSASAPLITVDHPALLDLDVTHRTANDTATAVLDHIDAFVGRPGTGPSR